MAGAQGNSRKLNHSHQGLTDNFRLQLGQSGSELTYEEVDFSQNELTSVGLRAVLDICRRCPKLKVVKLYRNNLHDDAAKGLADLCKECPGIEEMHLSHNHFTAQGVEVLVSAAEEVRPQEMSPLWLRLEQNDVVEPENLLRDFLSRGLSVCERADERSCTVRVCCKRQKIHLPHFTLQRLPRYRSGYPSGLRGVNLPPSVSRNARAAEGAVAGGGPAVRTTPKSGAPSVSMRSTNNGVPAWGANGVARRLPGQGATIPGGSPVAAPERRTAAGISAWANPAAKASASPLAAAGVEPPLAPVSLQRSTTAPPASEGSPTGPGNVERVFAAPDSAARAGDESNTAGGGGSGGGCSGESPVAREAPERNGTQGAEAIAPHSPQVAKSARPSLVLDTRGNRRIHPDQLEAEGTSQYICPLCNFWSKNPLISKCSHLFCDDCFRMWVQDQVNKAKKGSNGAVPAIQCPQPGCQGQLHKKDVQQLGGGQDATGKVMKRLRDNVQIRCVHHEDHIGNFPFGADADRILSETGCSCKWMGDAKSYEDHLKNCPIEQHLLAPSASPLGNEKSGNATPELSGSPKAANDSKADLDESTGGAGSAVADLSSEVRVVRHNYSPAERDKAQIALKANELVKIFETTDSGWAAGVRLCKETMQEIGDAGWFPAGYLYPPGHVAKS